MGCFNSKDSKKENGKPGASAGSNPTPQRGGLKPGVQCGVIKTNHTFHEKEFNIDDYQFLDRTDEKCIKEPGSIQGEKFVVENCSNCDIYVCDYCGEISVDDTKDSRIFIGPTEASIFIRDTSNCKIVAACKQFRIRDCQNLEILLFSSTEPVIESSKDIKFGCFDYFYFSLRHQFDQAKLNIWNNKWSEVHDFTAVKEGGKKKYHGLLPDSTTSKDMLTSLSEYDVDFYSEEMGEEIIVPRTYGRRLKIGSDFGFVFVFESGFSRADQLIENVTSENPSVKLARSRQTFTLTTDEYMAILAEVPNKKEVTKHGEKGCIGLEFFGEGCLEDLKKVLPEVFEDKSSYFVSPDNEMAQAQSKKFFEEFVEKLF